VPSQHSALGTQEREILALLNANPFAGQQEIASVLGLARSTVAAHITALTQKGYILGRAYVFPEPKRIFCCGGSTIDRKYWAEKQIVFGTKNLVRGHRAFGGVARNVAENLIRLGVPTTLMTIVGDDENGRSLVRHLRDLGVDTSPVVVTSTDMTAEYAAILGPDNELVVGMSDVAIFDRLGVSDLERNWPHLASASWVFVDCNLPADLLSALIIRKSTARFRLAVDAVSTYKATRLPRDLSGVDLLFLNNDEAASYLAHHGLGAPATPEAAARALLRAGAHEAVLTIGAKGYVVARGGKVTRYPAAAATAIDVIGAGDAMIAGALYRLGGGATLDQAAQTGALLAAMTTETDACVIPNLSPKLLAASEARGRRQMSEADA
jgi:pseudouridine kinase